MSHEPPKSQFATKAETQAVFCKARSNWLNQFAKLELEICRCLLKLADKCDGRKGLSLRLKDLAGIKPGPKLSKDRAKDLRMLATQCEGHLKLRSAIVHSVMLPGDRDGEPVALFQNVADAAHNQPFYVVMTQEDFKRTESDLRSLVAKLGSFIRPS